MYVWMRLSRASARNLMRDFPYVIGTNEELSIPVDRVVSGDLRSGLLLAV